MLLASRGKPDNLHIIIDGNVRESCGLRGRQEATPILSTFLIRRLVARISSGTMPVYVVCELSKCTLAIVSASAA